MSDSAKDEATSSEGAGQGARNTSPSRDDERYRALVEATSQAVWSWIPGETVGDLRRAQIWWEQLTGQSVAAQQAPDAWLDVVHPDDRADAAAAWAAAIAASAVYDTEYRVRGRQGDWRYVRAKGVPVMAGGASVREWIGTLDDVTAQRESMSRRDRNLAETDTERRQLDDVFRHAPSFMAVLRGPDHVFERVNNRYVELIGGRNVIGRPVCEALPEIRALGYLELLDNVYRTGEPHIVVDAHVMLHNPEGPIERVLEFVYQPLRDAAGRIDGIIVQGIDLTPRRSAEVGLSRVTAESNRQQRMFQTALSNTADFVYLFDTSGKFTYANKALLDLWRKDLSQAVGRNFFDLDYPPDLAARLQRQIQEVVDTARPLRDETTYTSAAGARAYEYIFVPVFGADGSVEAVAGSTRDITERKQSEVATRISEQRYRALVTATSDVVYRMSADWAEMQPLDGRSFIASSADPIRQWMNVNLPAFEHARVNEKINQAIANKEVFELEHQVIRADGTPGWTFSRAVPILNSDGEIVEWFGTAQDISRRKQVEEELRDIRSRMETALEAGTIGTWSWDVQADRFYGDVSLARIFSVAPSAVAGGSLSHIAQAIHPDDRERVGELVRRVVESGSRYETEYRVAQPNGSWRWVNARGQVERDASGRAVRFPGVVIDVTEQKQAQDALAWVTAESGRRKRLYETILSNTPDLAYVFDLDHRFIYANDVLLRMWGRTWDDAIGKTCLQLGYEPWHASMHDREIEEVKTTRKTVRGEVPFHGTFGRRIYEYILVPVLGANGEVEAVAGTTRDVTERKASEEALRDADRKKDDFIAMLAHELRNPLAPIRNGLQMMRLAGTDTAVIAAARAIMERQLSHMVRLIDDLLDVSRVTRNKMELRRTSVTLAEVVANALEAAGPAIQEVGHELTVELPPEPILLDADLTRLAQVFSNLLTNSAKYTPRGGFIWLTAQRSDGEAVISVRDTGIGIPADALPTIFDMFSQVDRSVERSAGGLGIGLALVRGLVEMHGGSVVVESMEGKGSTFTVRLPVMDSANSFKPSAQSTAPGSASRRRVLVVDDNLDSAQSMSELLRIMGNEVVMAHDGLEAVATANSFRPEVILMDIGLPHLSGLDATRRIREQPWGQNVTIIALTGWGQEADRERSQNAGCNAHLVKPVDLIELERLLEKLPPISSSPG
ncbi:MAG: PAS domain-containing protein [Pyrinomonadaceae bacterium]|nr:PAS domain-containing protein [Phycisphaerales bacterium]